MSRLDRKRGIEETRSEADMDILSLQVVLSSVEGGMDVAEMFSPPRVNIQAARLGMSTGWSMDIGTTDPWSGKAWDLSDRRCQALALKLVCQHQPKFLMLSPPCTLFKTRITGRGREPGRHGTTRRWNFSAFAAWWQPYRCDREGTSRLNTLRQPHRGRDRR